MSKQIISTENAPSAVGPYSQAVRHGDMIFVSGQIPVNPETKTMPESSEDQARQCLNNLKAILEEAGSGMDKIIRAGIFLTDLGDFATVNEVYASFFDGDYPARACVEVSKLPLGANVEIECVAYV
ncbi:RidA family protein [Pseudodesulfovibrio senegalensis]|jgi:2-iminobutanoate/2-iminopropanoate deaminase|uniref:RidA family protein n=1 Tax=Pseudodesulfovibrio senegalensis TaxID=1721087 RepID=A0A6N6N4Y4_9BACT|nr:RidA family protein [Pseudodesulfovibrio senegalensis]KAB1443116.1 RidA family protein [Pseudodesulfovibrio senegalensis]